ncbi:hypothetical protein Pfo_010458 [Paulownia fortunei]|nr:hypothetical protein Pfo_010458 [Paulownia fortunei]
MTKHRWEGSMKSFGNHIGPEKEELLKWVKIEIENKVKRILKITKSINGNKDGNLKKKSEIIHLVEDFHQQYESLYSLYEDLRGEVKNNVNSGDDGSSTSLSDSESYYSPEELNVKNSETSSEIPNVPHIDNQEPETSDVEDTILKDKLTSSSEVKETTTFGSQSQEFTAILKDLTIQDEGSENTRQRLAQMMELEGEVASLKTEIETLCTKKRQLEEQAECKSNEGVQMQEKISRLEARILEQEDNEQWCLSKISDLVARTKNLQLEVNTLHLQKGELEERLSCETKERSLQVEGLMEQVNSLKQDLASVNSQKDELELELKKKSTKMSDCLLQMENQRNKLTNQALIEQGSVEVKESLKLQVKDFELEVHSLSSKKSDLEDQIMKINHEAYQSGVEKQELQGKVSELRTSLSESENELSAQEKKIKACQNELSAQIESLNDKVKNHENTLGALQNKRNSLQVELEALRNDRKIYHTELEKEKQESSISKSQMEKKNTELTNKIADQQKTLLELGDAMSKLKVENEKAQIRISDSKSNFQLVERKIDEMADELRKQFEDKYRILSRRIRVAEQLHVENKEWYLKTKKTYEQENKSLKERFRNVNDMSLTANDLLISLETVALKFEECNANFLNRISKASCELKFAKDWAMRKNKALLHMKDDLDCLLSQLDDKEAEILIFREKVWKSENKMREFEKIIKEKEDGMLGLQEEKREAIRQLCVWIDYHRSRSDYYKKMLSEMNPGRMKAS